MERDLEDNLAKTIRSPSASVADRVQRLLDRQEILDQLARHYLQIDSLEGDGLAGIFTDDCVVDYGPGLGGEMTGHEPLRRRKDATRSTTRVLRSHHQIGQVLIEFDGDTASSITFLTNSQQLADGRFRDARSQHRDRWIRTADGWRIRYRIVLATVIEDAPEAQRHWLVPLPPDAR